MKKKVDSSHRKQSSNRYKMLQKPAEEKWMENVSGYTMIFRGSPVCCIAWQKNSKWWKNMIFTLKHLLPKKLDKSFTTGYGNFSLDGKCFRLYDNDKLL